MLKEKVTPETVYFFVLYSKKTTLSWVTDSCLSLHSASDPNEIPSKEVQNSSSGAAILDGA